MLVSRLKPLPKICNKQSKDRPYFKEATLQSSVCARSMSISFLLVFPDEFNSFLNRALNSINIKEMMPSIDIDLDID